MAYYLKLYFSTLAVFFAIDMVWLGLVASTFYRKHLGFLMAPIPTGWRPLFFTCSSSLVSWSLWFCQGWNRGHSAIRCFAPHSLG